MVKGCGGACKSSSAVKEKKNVKNNKKSGGSEKRASGRAAGYIAFMAEVRPQIKEEHPKWKAQQISREGGKRWRALSEAEKSTYNGKVSTPNE